MSSPRGWFTGLLLNGADGPATRAANYLANAAYPNVIPPIDSLMESAAQGLVHPDTINSWLRYHGVDKPAVPWGGPNVLYRDGRLLFDQGGILQPRSVWESAYWQRLARPSAEQVREMFFRGTLSQTDASLWMRREGFTQAGLVQAYFDLAKVIPPPSSLLSMALRFNLDSRALDPGNLLQADFPPALQFWCDRQGFGEMTLPGPGGKGSVSMNWARAIWALHWQIPTLREGFMMQNRLRVALGPGNVPHDPSGVVFDNALLDPILRQNSIHPFWEKALRAISYSPISIRHARILYREGVIDGAGLYEIMRDNNYNDRDARLIATANIRYVERTKNAEALRAARGAVEKAWSLGTIDDATFVALQQQAGLDTDQAQAALALADVTRKEERVRKLFGVLRAQYKAGKIDRTYAQNTLSGIGMEPQRINDHLDDWDIERQGQTRELGAAQIVRYAGEGLIPLDVAAVRLRNLQYSETDVALLVTEARIRLNTLLARQIEKQAREQERSRKALIAAQKQADAARKAARAELARHGSPAELKKWFCSGLIGQREVLARLQALGWPLIDSQRLLDECVVDKKARKGKPPLTPGITITPIDHKETTAQISNWVRRCLLTPQQAKDKLKGLGWNDDDADLIIKYAQLPTKPKGAHCEAGKEVGTAPGPAKT